jgi:hypothetical protein
MATAKVDFPKTSRGKMCTCAPLEKKGSHQDDKVPKKKKRKKGRRSTAVKREVLANLELKSECTRVAAAGYHAQNCCPQKTKETHEKSS